MNRGDFLRLAEAVSETGQIDLDFQPESERIVQAQANVFHMELLFSISAQSLLGEKSATIGAATKPGHFTERQIVTRALHIVSDAIQQEGFQTHRDYAETTDSIQESLTVFWADGKRIFEERLAEARKFGEA